MHENSQDELSQLDKLDLAGGVNKEPVRSLGKAEKSSFEPQLTSSNISLANELGWKVVPFDNLPSTGLSYPTNAEIAIRSATVNEIRHWSTIDETDNVSINDKLNFILEKCLSFKIKGAPIILDWRDIAVVDRFFLVFRIHELTFPNNENIMSKFFQCGKCPSESRYSEVIQVRSSMLQLYSYPEEVMHFYNEENRAFLVESQKFDPFFLCMPTLGAQEKVKTYIRSKGGKLKDDWFIKVAPYLIDDYRSVSNESLDRLRIDSTTWHQNKFMFVTKAVEQLEAGKSTSIAVKCPKCDNFIHQNIFTQPSFTVKNLFIVPTRLVDLV